MIRVEPTATRAPGDFQHLGSGAALLGIKLFLLLDQIIAVLGETSSLSASLPMYPRDSGWARGPPLRLWDYYSSVVL